MGVIDIVILAVAAFGAFKGWRNGMIKEIFGLLAVIIGLWAGIRLAFLFADHYKATHAIPEKSIPVIAFLSAFLIGMGVVVLIGFIIDKIFDATVLDVPNKTIGAIFGALKWMYICGALLCILGTSGYLGAEKNKSSLYPYATGFCVGVNEYSIALIPSAKNVFAEMDTYFSGFIPPHKSDSTQKKP